MTTVLKKYDSVIASQSLSHMNEWSLRQHRLVLKVRIKQSQTSLFEFENNRSWIQQIKRFCGFNLQERDLQIKIELYSERLKAIYELLH